MTTVAQSCYEIGDRELEELKEQSELLHDARPTSACLYGDVAAQPPRVETRYEFLRPTSDGFQNVRIAQKVSCVRSVQPLRCTVTDVAELTDGSLVRLYDHIVAREVYDIATLLKRLLREPSIDSIERARIDEGNGAYDVTLREAPDRPLLRVYRVSQQCTLERCAWRLEGPRPLSRVY